MDYEQIVVWERIWKWGDRNFFRCVPPLFLATQVHLVVCFRDGQYSQCWEYLKYKYLKYYFKYMNSILYLYFKYYMYLPAVSYTHLTLPTKRIV